jgi:hypothetical protein
MLICLRKLIIERPKCNLFLPNEVENIGSNFHIGMISENALEDDKDKMIFILFSGTKHWQTVRK